MLELIHVNYAVNDLSGGQKYILKDINLTISENDIILTLSTCYDDYEKMVLHAKLIKKEKK